MGHAHPVDLGQEVVEQIVTLAVEAKQLNGGPA